MTTAAIIQARLGSSRLPGKVLADIAGKPMLQRVYERATAIRGIYMVIIAIPDDEPTLVHWIHSALAAPVYRGSPTDVLARYTGAAACCEADTIMRITADCPLFDPAIAETCLALYRAERADLLDNLPADGFDCEIFSMPLLDIADSSALDPADREHVTPWMRRQPWVSKANLVLEPAPKLSVDTAEDLELVRAIYATIGRDLFSRAEALDALSRVRSLAR